MQGPSPGRPQPHAPRHPGPRAGLRVPPLSALHALARDLRVGAPGFEYNSLRRTRARVTNGIKDSGPSPEGSAGTGPPLPGSWDSFASLPVLRRAGEGEVASRIPGLGGPDPVPREEAQASGTPALGPGSRPPSTRPDPGKGGRLSCFRQRTLLCALSLVFIYFFFFSYFSRSVWKHVPVFLSPNTSSLPFLCTADAQGGRVCQQLARFASSEQSPDLRSASPRTPGALGSTTRFQEWGPSAWAGHLRDFFLPPRIQRQRATTIMGATTARSPRKGWAKHPTNPLVWSQKDFFRNLSPFSPSEPYTLRIS